MPNRSTIVLASALRVMKPLVRLLLRHGVAYPAFASALKQVFLEAARDELRAQGARDTDSALSLMSGVHRRDVRTLSRGAGADATTPADDTPLNLASQVVARWLSQPEGVDAQGQPLPLERSAGALPFDDLVAQVSSDVRPRAVLDELLRLGMAEEVGNQVRLLAHGFVPRQGFAEMAQLLQHNLHDHVAAATLNLDGEHNYLEQAVHVDELSAESVAQLHRCAAQAWRQAFRTVMAEAQARFDHDQAHSPPDERLYRARFGSYFYAADRDENPR